jgi:hypothetical protein
MRDDRGASAIRRINSKVADARAHAEKAVTETLKAKQDGRATLRHANRSPSLAAAMARLDELLDDLAGPSSTSLQGILRDGREAIYREAFARWLPQIPPELLVRPDPEPTAAAIAAARGVVLHGRDLRSDIGAVVATAQQRLRSAVVLAGSAGGTVDQLGAWEQSARQQLSRAVQLAWGDAAIALERMAGADLIHPDHIEAVE